jgi:hypothetical protein
MTAPNHREREMAQACVEKLRTDPRLVLSLTAVLARYRDDLLTPFEALRVDFEALGDERAARYLDGLLQAARKGES